MINVSYVALDQDRSRTSRKEVTQHKAYRHTIDRKIG
jgi:hypothetical protein